MTKSDNKIPDGAVRLSAVELNDIHFSVRHTVLTPELLERMAAQSGKKPSVPAPAVDTVVSVSGPATATDHSEGSK